MWANKEGGGSSDSKLFRIKHEYIVVYARNIELIDIAGVKISNRHILWTMPNPMQAAKEWTRVLKPWGTFIVIFRDWFFDRPFNNFQIFLGKILIPLGERKQDEGCRHRCGCEQSGPCGNN